jgi:hypothetical protein
LSTGSSISDQFGWYLHRQNLFEEEEWFLVLPQVINLAGICIDKISLRRRRGKPATSHVLYGNQLLETCVVNLHVQSNVHWLIFSKINGAQSSNYN